MSFYGASRRKLGPVWTHENHRGLGLATFATRELVKQFIDQTHMYFWWFCKAENKGSMRVAESSAFLFRKRNSKNKTRCSLVALLVYFGVL